MYTIFLGKQVLSDPLSTREMLSNVTLSLKKNDISELNFTIYPDHPLYYGILKNTSLEEITVYSDSDLLFIGHISDLSMNINADIAVHCVSILDFLKNIRVDDISVYMNGSELFKKIFEDQYNGRVLDFQKIYVGRNDGDLILFNSITIKSNGSTDLFSFLKSNLLDKYDCHCSLRKENGMYYVDLIKDVIENPVQLYEYGNNLISLDIKQDLSNRVNGIYILGAKNSAFNDYLYDRGYVPLSTNNLETGKSYYYTEDNEQTFIPLPTDADPEYYRVYEYMSEYDESDKQRALRRFYNSKDYHYTVRERYGIINGILYDKEIVEAYGLNVEIYSDESLASETSMLDKAIELLNKKNKISEINASGVDLYWIGEADKPLNVGDYVRIKADIFDVDETMVCVSMDLNLNEPSQSSYSFGKIPETLTGILKS